MRIANECFILICRRPNVRSTALALPVNPNTAVSFGIGRIGMIGGYNRV